MGNREAAAPVSRRSLLRGVLGFAGLAGLGALGPYGLSGCSRGSPEPLPDQLDDFIASTAALADRYEASIGGAPPELAATLTAIRDAHRQHVDALVAALASAPVTPGPAQPSSVAELLVAEDAARNEAVAACLSASGRLAPLLGAIAAARATHVEVLS